MEDVETRAARLLNYDEDAFCWIIVLTGLVFVGVAETKRIETAGSQVVQGILRSACAIFLLLPSINSSYVLVSTQL